MEYYFEEIQHLKFQIYDCDSKSAQLDQHDFVGEVTCSMGDVVGAGNGSFVGDLKKDTTGKKRGVLHVNAEEIGGANGTVHLHFRAQGLDNKDWFGKSDPYLQFSYQGGDGQFRVFHKTEVLKNTLSPTWKAFEIDISLFCGSDYDRPIEVKCFDWDSDGSHDHIGFCTTTLRELSSSEGKDHWDLINPKKMPGGKKAKRGYKNSGVLHKLACTVIPKATFMDYLVGGLELLFTAAIDFTGSNGHPQNPQSLHYINPYQMNEYQAALHAIGGVIQDYDSDKMFPALGYGAKLPTGAVSHEFALNGNEGNPYCQGIAGIMAAYQQALQVCALYGPTNFAPVINHVKRFAEQSKQGPKHGQEYFVLLILTDGAITDTRATIDAIVAAARLPMSIIIVGVGSADFTTMNMLDGDDAGLRSSRGELAERDIVQFVPFRKFAQAPDLLAKEVLHELPDQICRYMAKAGFNPKK